MQISENTDGFLKADGAFFTESQINSTGKNAILPSLRTAAALAAMQGIISMNGSLIENDETVPLTPSNVARASVMYADALLDELNKEIK